MGFVAVSILEYLHILLTIARSKFNLAKHLVGDTQKHTTEFSLSEYGILVAALALDAWYQKIVLPTWASVGT